MTESNHNGLLQGLFKMSELLATTTCIPDECKHCEGERKHTYTVQVAIYNTNLNN